MAPTEGYETSEESSASEPVFPARDVIVAIRRRWWLVALVFVSIVMVGMWYTLQQPRLYRSSVTVRVEEQQAPIAGMRDPGSYNYRVDPLQSEQTIIRSQAVAERVADTLGLRLAIAQPPELRRSVILGDGLARVAPEARNESYRLVLEDRSFALVDGENRLGSATYGDTLRAGGLALSIESRPPIDERSILLDVRPLTAAANVVQRGVSTQVVENTDIIRIDYVGTDPSLVQKIADAVANVYARYSAEGQRTRARSRTAFIAQSLREQEQRLEEAQDELLRFKEAHGTADVSADLGALLTTIHAVEGDRRAVLMEQSVYKELVGRLAAADTVDEELRRLSGTQAVTTNAYIATLYDRWFELDKEREQLLSDLEPHHPDVLAVDRLIAATKAEIQDASRLYLQALESKLATYGNTIRELRAEAEDYPPLQAQQAQLEADVATIQGTYTALQSEYQLARIAESVEGGKVRIIDQAPLPTSPVAPNRTRALMMLIVLGVLVGVALALVLEKLDTSIKAPDEIQERFGIPVLGLIPTIRVESASRGAAASALSRVVAHGDPRSPVAEAYRSLRTNLAFARAQRDVRAIVFTSPGPADGKSTSVANLAITFAQQGQRTLLIDADLRRAVLDRTFGVPRSPGLTDAIIGHLGLAEIVNGTDVENLFVLGSGHFPPNPSELLGSPGMRSVLQDARQNYDIVLLDSPPLLAVTDAAVLATMVDGAILVVRMQSTAREAVRRALSQLKAVHSRVLGALMNDVDMSKASYYGGYGYQYYEYYGDAGSNGANGRRGRGVMARLRRLTGQGSRRGAGGGEGIG
ncbi:MAG: GumC family protein [Gemmatimonadaceae bacterium]